VNSARLHFTKSPEGWSKTNFPAQPSTPGLCIGTLATFCNLALLKGKTCLPYQGSIGLK